MSRRPERSGSSDILELRGSSDSPISAQMESRDSSSSGTSRRSIRESGKESDERQQSAGSSGSSPKPTDENVLPTSFGRGATTEETDLDVIQRMTKSFIHAPLGNLAECIDGERKVKIWTRNFKAVRGICIGYLVAFDKHWNLILSDVDEAYLKPKRNKTPFLSDIESASRFVELPPKVCKPKKKREEIQKPPEKAAVSGEVPETGEKKAKKKRKKKKKKGCALQRHVNQMFIRGDNIVMLEVTSKED